MPVSGAMMMLELGAMASVIKRSSSSSSRGEKASAQELYLKGSVDATRPISNEGGVSG